VICEQQVTAKREKLLHENTKVDDELHISKQSADHQQSDTKTESQHSYMVSEGLGDRKILAADDGLSHSLQQADTVKDKVTRDEKASKKDAADIVVRQLTPYYKSHRFGSKVRYRRVCYFENLFYLYLSFIFRLLRLCLLLFPLLRLDFCMAQCSISP